MSSGDYVFCRRAQAEGFKLEYSADAIVDHPSRTTLAEIRRKALRVGYGHGQRAALYRDGGAYFLNPRTYFPVPPRFDRARRLNIVLPLWRLLWLWALNTVVIRWSYVIGSLRGYRAASGEAVRDAETTRNGELKGVLDDRS